MCPGTQCSLTYDNTDSLHIRHNTTHLHVSRYAMFSHLRQHRQFTHQTQYNTPFRVQVRSVLSPTTTQTVYTSDIIQHTFSCPGTQCSLTYDNTDSLHIRHNTTHLHVSRYSVLSPTTTQTVNTSDIIQHTSMCPGMQCSLTYDNTDSLHIRHNTTHLFVSRYAVTSHL